MKIVIYVAPLSVQYDWDEADITTYVDRPGRHTPRIDLGVDGRLLRELGFLPGENLVDIYLYRAQGIRFTFIEYEEDIDLYTYRCSSGEVYLCGTGLYWFFGKIPTVFYLEFPEKHFN